MKHFENLDIVKVYVVGFVAYLTNLIKVKLLLIISPFFQNLTNMELLQLIDIWLDILLKSVSIISFLLGGILTAVAVYEKLLKKKEHKA